LVAPLEGEKARLYARHYSGSIHADEVVDALRYFRRKVGRRLVIVWDRLQAHRSRRVADFVRTHSADFRLEWLPPYAPDLNPEEGCNSMVKSDTRNLPGASEDALYFAVRASFRRVGKQAKALRAFCEHAGLLLN
jgi:transposase